MKYTQLILPEAKLHHIIDEVSKPLAVFVAVLGIRWSLEVLIPHVVTRPVNNIFLVVAILLTIWLIIRLYEAIHGKLVVSTKYVIISKLILSLLVAVAVLYFVWGWITRPIDCIPDCIGANLVSRDLHKAHLARVNFVGADFRGSDLSEADLHRADLSGANLIQTNLKKVDLRGAKLIGANLSGADLRGAFLDDTDLSGANLTRANLTGVELTGVRLSGATFDTAQLIYVKLSKTKLRGGIFTRADLTGSDLTGADLSGSKFSWADLSGTVMRQTDLSGAWLNLANLTGADLTDANLEGSSLIGSKLASANLTGSKLAIANLISANLNGANLRGADLTGVRLLKAELKPGDFKKDPLLDELNEEQRSQVIKDAVISGVDINDDTTYQHKWLHEHIPVKRKQMSKEEKELYRTVFKQRLKAYEFMRLMRIGEWKTEKSNQILIKQGESVSDLIFIYEGSATVEVDGNIVTTLGKGAFIGEVSLMTDDPASATVKVNSPARLVRWPQKHLRQMLEKNQRLQDAIKALLFTDMAQKLSKQK